MNYISRVGIDFKTVGTSNKKSVHGKTNQEIIRIVYSAVEEVTGITYDEITVPNRKIVIRQARQMVHYFLKAYTNLSLMDIGKQTKNDHSTVIHSCKVVELDCADKIYKTMLESVEEQIKLCIFAK